jgi:branched-chain amino acid transport system substrate-binding protein
MKKLSMLSTLIAATTLLFSQNSLAADCDEIVIGSAISLTGKYATNGVHAKNGYEYAITKIKENGGVKIGDKCYNFRVIYYDDESKGDRGATLAERLISQDKVQYMLGPYSSGMTKAIAPVTEKYKIPMVEAEGASRSLFNKGYKYLFAVRRKVAGLYPRPGLLSRSKTIPSRLIFGLAYLKMRPNTA